MRAQHVIALSGPPLVIVRGNYEASKRFFLRPTAIPLEQKLTQNPPESPLRAPLAWHTKSPNSLIYARKKVRDLNGKGVALVRVLAGSLL